MVVGSNSVWVLGKPLACTIGWVKLYQKFEIEKYTVNSFYHNWLANLHGFANVCKLPISNTFKDMQSKI